MLSIKDNQLFATAVTHKLRTCCRPSSDTCEKYSETATEWWDYTPKYLTVCIKEIKCSCIQDWIQGSLTNYSNNYKVASLYGVKHNDIEYTLRTYHTPGGDAEYALMNNYTLGYRAYLLDGLTRTPYKNKHAINYVKSAGSYVKWQLGAKKIWVAEDWTIGDRCLYKRPGYSYYTVYELQNSNKTAEDTTDPFIDTDWVVVGSALYSYSKGAAYEYSYGGETVYYLCIQAITNNPALAATFPDNLPNYWVKTDETEINVGSKWTDYWELDGDEPGIGNNWTNYWYETYYPWDGIYVIEYDIGALSYYRTLNTADIYNFITLSKGTTSFTFDCYRYKTGVGSYTTFFKSVWALNYSKPHADLIGQFTNALRIEDCSTTFGVGKIGYGGTIIVYEPCPLCQYCTMKSPPTIRLSITSRTVCTTCYQAGEDSSIKFAAGAITIQTNFTLIQNRDNICLWEYEYELSTNYYFKKDVYSTNDCTGSIASTVLYKKLFISIEKTSNTTILVNMYVQNSDETEGLYLIDNEEFTTSAENPFVTSEQTVNYTCDDEYVLSQIKLKVLEIV